MTTKNNGDGKNIDASVAVVGDTKSIEVAVTNDIHHTKKITDTMATTSSDNKKVSADDDDSTVKHILSRLEEWRQADAKCAALLSSPAYIKSPQDYVDQKSSLQKSSDLAAEALSADTLYTETARWFQAQLLRLTADGRVGIWVPLSRLDPAHADCTAVFVRYRIIDLHFSSTRGGQLVAELPSSSTPLFKLPRAIVESWKADMFIDEKDQQPRARPDFFPSPTGSAAEQDMIRVYTFSMEWPVFLSVSNRIA